MTLSPDEIELAQRIADALEEAIEAVHSVFYHSNSTKSDCCRVLMEPLRSGHRIDTLLESLPPHNTKSLGEAYHRLMSCFDATGKLIDQDLRLRTVERYVNDLIEELRSISRKIRQNTATVEEEKPHSHEDSKPIAERFTFRSGQVLFDDRDLDVGTGAVLDIAQALVENFGHVVPFRELDENSLENEASEKIRTAIGRLREAIESARIPVVIENRKAEGYVMLPASP